MTIRPATVRDRAAVVTLALRFHTETAYRQLIAVDAERIGALFDVALRDGIVLVAERDVDLVAFLALVALDHTLSGDRYAEEIAWWVEPAYRSGTLGPRLLARGEAWAAEHGCAFINMVAPAFAIGVADYYQRRGYAAVETTFMKRLTEAA